MQYRKLLYKFRCFSIELEIKACYSNPQKHLGFLAHVMESIKNVFNFSVPFLSWLAFVVIFIVTIVLYFVPLRLVPGII